jgi:protein TonB
MTRPAVLSAPHAWSDTARTGGFRSPLATALLLSATVHLAIILVLGFKLPDLKPHERSAPPLEIMVLRNPVPGDAKPAKPDALAQTDQLGGGPGGALARSDREQEDLGDEAPPAAPVPAPPASEPQASAEEQRQSTLSLDKRTDSSAAPPEPAPPAVSAAQILASRSLEIAKLTARIEETGTAYASRPRRRAISASTREYKYANYLEAWRRKVERIGNLNYPEEAKRRKLYGSLILRAAVRADGSLESVQVLRSSGVDVLDEAAVRIVKLAAPFAPFPPDIRGETDILDITRTWQFLSSNRLGWER